MVEEWKKAAEVSRELEHKAPEHFPLNILPHVLLPLKEQLLICSLFTKIYREDVCPTYKVVLLELLLIQHDLALQFLLGLQDNRLLVLHLREKLERLVWLRRGQNG